MDERRTVLERLFHVRRRRERLVVHLDELSRVLRESAALRDDHGDPVALVTRLVDREREVRRHLDVLRHRPGAGERALPVVGEVGAAERRHDSLGSAGGVEVDVADARVRIGRSDDGHVDRARQLEVLDPRGPPDQQRRVLLALDRRADRGLVFLQHSHGQLTPAAAETAFTMLWYPVQRQRLPSRPVRIASSPVASPLSIRLTAANTIPGVQ